MAVKEFLKPTSKNTKNIKIQAILILSVIFDQPWKSTAVYRWTPTQCFKTIIFCFVFITAESMSSIHIKQ